ncbi:hypothetical protein PV755_09200 [Streptomyces caniscabiei]|uniref:Uncharacterized protein n=1 Tax=Streptomyces caniscabiei TaxID=2746961 RepID=A0A927KWZ8_9ACTN|nr:hypothetical protein [Streptomyces caniscabiei]MBD9721906.1 hypothetical protein [Streptomyces caniscabiei]MDX3509097.1 hypothetical protein [Streptomyces caniscabiei]MDX3717150.1 hypothetical protein [Streptomyces caniscabiei]WEO23017.1 hypothetical protein IHE65_07525 [Streptomyces caniscabiei]
MIGETTEYTMIVHGQQKHTVPDAVQAAPGLVVFRMPAEQSLNNPARWRIGHHEGLAVAEAMRREDALKGIDILKKSGIDWTQDTDTIKAQIGDETARDLYAKLSYAWCDEPGSHYMPGDVSANGTYTDVDIEAAAAEFKASQFNALEVMCAMTHSVPWMGLDTEDFNEAHNRIVDLSGAA